ncbi:uncharacterized protein LOC144452848 isoform X2 [Glandiceps talaboti]
MKIRAPIEFAIFVFIFMLVVEVLWAKDPDVAAKQRRQRDDDSESRAGRSELNLRCRSRDNQVVDWWLLYKPSMASYAEFAYFDSQSDKGNFLGVTSLADVSSPLTTTFSPLAESRVGSSVTYFGYSNEMNRLLDLFPLRGHSPVSNGFLAVDSSAEFRGFWLIHNDIYFPPSQEGQGRIISNPDNWGWMASGKDIQLTYLCISLQKHDTVASVLDFLRQLNPFTFLERVTMSSPMFLTKFLQRSNETAGQIYLEDVFTKYKTCLESIPGDRTYSDCVKSSEISTPGSSSFNLLSRNKGTVGDVCLDVSNPRPHLRKSLLPPLTNYNGIFAVVGENPKTHGVVCIGDMENTMVSEIQSDTNTLFAGETTDYILQKLISAHNNSEIDKYGGVSGGLVCFNHEALWDTLLTADLYMEGNCFDSIDDIKSNDLRMKRGKRTRDGSAEHSDHGQQHPKRMKTMERDPLLRRPLHGGTLNEDADVEMSDVEAESGRLGDVNAQERISGESLSHKDRITCLALHCDKYDDYAWLVYKPPEDEKDVSVVILKDLWAPRPGVTLKKLEGGIFIIDGNSGDIKIDSEAGQKLDIKLYRNLFDVPFNFDEMDLITDEYQAIRIENMKPKHREVHVQFRVSMTTVGDPDFETLKSGKTFNVKSTNNFEDFMHSQMQQNEIPMCFDWCPLEGCSYKILKRSPDVEEIEYKLLGRSCKLNDESPPDTLINTARDGGCTHEMFRSYQCLIYETTETQCDVEVEAVGFGATEFPIEPLSNIDIKYSPSELLFLKYRFCQSNIIQYLFYGAPWEKDAIKIKPDKPTKKKKRSTHERVKRKVVDEGTDITDCNRFFAGDPWPPKVTNTADKDLVRICQTCRRPAASTNDYCFATLFNTYLRLPEYSAYAIKSTPARFKAGTVIYSRGDLKGDQTLWNRFEIGLCRNNPAPNSPLVYKAGDAMCEDLGAVTVRPIPGPAATQVTHYDWAGPKGNVVRTPHRTTCTTAKVSKPQCVDKQQYASEFVLANQAARSVLYDKGHLNPSGIHNHDLYEMGATFILTNAAAQIGKDFNQREWLLLECLLRTYIFYMRKTSTGGVLNSEVYLLTGTHATKKKQILGTVLTDPEFFWTAMCDPEQKISIAFMGTNDPNWNQPSRITIFASLEEFHDWLWEKGTDKKIFPGKFQDCMLNAKRLNLRNVPTTMNCYNPTKGLPHAVNVQPMANRWRVVILLDQGIRLLSGFLNRNVLG